MVGLAAFNEKAVALRAALFGVELSHNGTKFTGYLSANSTKRNLEGGGFTFDAATVIRIPTSAGITPKIGDRIVVVSSGQSLLIDEVATHPLNPELKLTVSNTSTT